MQGETLSTTACGYFRYMHSIAPQALLLYHRNTYIMQANIFGELITTTIEQTPQSVEGKFCIHKFIDGRYVMSVPVETYGQAIKIEKSWQS